MNFAKLASCKIVVRFVALAAVASIPRIVRGQTNDLPHPQPEEIAQFLFSARPQVDTPTNPPFEEVRASLTSRGFLRYVGAPSAYHYAPSAGGGTADPISAARAFLLDHRWLFGLVSDRLDLAPVRMDPGVPRSSIRLQQFYRGLPIIAAETTVQLDASNGVLSVFCDVEQDTRSLDDGTVSLDPQVTAAQATDLARAAFADQVPAAELRTGPAVLSIFAPAVLDETGPQQLVWDIEVSDADKAMLDYRVLVDANNGNIVRTWTLIPTALNRTILDKTNSPTVAAGVVRQEGGAASGLAEADNAYTYLGDTYNFYWVQHGRDSYDGNGAPLSATVRYCDTNPQNSCPLRNAFASLIFGAGFATDDGVAHEFTHKVTSRESGLIYANASGAINESFSDIWGEFVDWSSASSTDTPAVRWDIGEDIPGGRLRSMSNPPALKDPDRLGSSLYVPATNNPSRTNDNGGVHSNSGVNNKLCYLLTDGDTFNGHSVYGMGMVRVVELYYEANVNLLTPGSGWTDLYNALRQAAVTTLRWSKADQDNLCRACLAVEITSFDTGWSWYVDQSSSCIPQFGTKTCGILAGPFTQVSQGYQTAAPGDTLYIRTGSYNEQLTFNKVMRIRAYDGPATIGR